MELESFHSKFVLKPEDVELETYYSMTINLNKLDGDLNKDYLRYKYCLMKYLSNIRYFEFKFYLELSPKGRYHIHGEICFIEYSSVLTFFEMLSHLPHQYALNTKDNTGIWDEYMIKGRKYIGVGLSKLKYPYEMSNENCPKLKRLRQTTFDDFQNI